MGRSAEEGEEEYDRFFDECLPLVLALGRRLTGNQTEAEDVAVEALGRAFARWGRVRGLPYRQAWVLRVAVNVVIGEARRRPLPEIVRVEEPDVAETVVLRQALRDALRRLPRRQREAVALRYLADLSEVDAAAAMGVSSGSVKTHLSRGLAALRVLMGPGNEIGGSFGVEPN